jgi:DNA-binding MarR family transcriptional regulator
MDGRASSIQLTPAGLAMFEDIRNDYGAADERLLGALDADERRTFLDLLAKVSARSAEWD